MTPEQHAPGTYAPREEFTARANVSAQDAERALEVIYQAVAEIQSLNQQIATAVEEQSLVAEEINGNVVKVSGLAEESATANAHAAASVNELARLGGDLQQMVARFRV